MAQFARPEADTLIGNWADDGEGTSDIYTAIDEEVADDNDYIASPVSPSDEPYVCKLSAVDDPQSSSGHTVRYRYRKDQADGDQIDLTVELREGYVDEGTPGTLIHQEVHTDISGSDWTSGSFTLDGEDADSITDYSDLYLRFVANKPSS